MSFLRKATIILVVLIIIVAVFYFYFYRPANQDLLDANNELRDLQMQRKKLQDRAATIDQFRADRARVKERLDQLLTKLPNTRDVNIILREFEGLATVLGLDIASFALESETNKGFYSEIPITMKLTGRYHDIAIFFDKISKADRIINFTDLDITSPKNVEGILTITTNCTATAYRFNPTGAAR
ncbi:MAG: type 4a pilus biogenesis protein PilO [Candidatus Alcyoniella australis]|nr:type 4a pilus biogenesis protein PilO [Candidatus Alcyoniella australis]